MPQNLKLLPDKGYERLEPYAMKVARTVLRRGGASNRSFLFGCLKKNLQKTLHSRSAIRNPAAVSSALELARWAAWRIFLMSARKYS